MLNLKILNDQGDPVQVQCEGNLSRLDLAENLSPFEHFLGPGGFARQVQLNLEQVEFIDSNGIGWLVECHKRFRAAGGGLSLCKLPPRILQVLQFCKLDRYFHIIRDNGGSPAAGGTQA